MYPVRIALLTGPDQSRDCHLLDFEWDEFLILLRPQRGRYPEWQRGCQQEIAVRHLVWLEGLRMLFRQSGPHWPHDGSEGEVAQLQQRETTGGYGVSLGALACPLRLVEPRLGFHRGKEN